MAPFGASRAGLMSTRVDAIPDSAVLIPEENDLTNFDGPTSDHEIIETSPASEFTGLAWNVKGEGNTVISKSGLDNYPTRGDTFHTKFYLDNSDDVAQAAFNGQDTDNYHLVAIDAENDRIRIFIVEDGNVSSLSESNFTIPIEENLTLEGSWATDDEFVATLYDGSDSELGSVSETINPFENGSEVETGIGHRGFNRGGNLLQFDWLNEPFNP